MRKLDKHTVDQMVAAGIGFVAGVPTPEGQQSVYLEAGDLEEFVTDNELWFAKKHGVTKEDYLRWLETKGTPQCGFFLQNGQRCRNTVSGGIQRSLLDWLQEDTGFCQVHGGASSAEAKSARRSKRK